MSNIADVVSNNLPRHLAIIMDGNGRWAKNRNLPRIAGHKAGVDSLHAIVKACVAKKIQALTVYAFSSENWKRPGSEVSLLMDLFVTSLQKDVNELSSNNVRLRFIGDLFVFSEKLQNLIVKAERLTSKNTGLQFVVAINYGGRWDITNTFRTIAQKIKDGKINPEDIDEDMIQASISLADLPEPDLFIRTGGEMRISNYLLWQLAYTELYFTECLWPDFSPEELDKALIWYGGRERRFGCISEQLSSVNNA
jgi:undecaprenyl diphosphate synthase